MEDDGQAASASAAQKRARKQTSPDVDAVIKAESPSPNSKRRKVISGKVAAKEASPAADGATHNGSSNDAADASNKKLPRLPIEIWLNIFGFIPRRDTGTTSAVSRVSKAFHQAISPLLYRQLTACAPSRPNICGFVKLLEPFLSITQLKELHSNSSPEEYPGQNRTYPVIADEDAVPYCAQHVKRLLVGWTNPAGVRMEVLSSYIEKLLANLTNLETLLWNDVHISLTPEINARIASLNLKAFAYSFDNAHVVSFDGLRNLSYLDIFFHKNCNLGNNIQDLIWKSHETLETLIYEEAEWPRTDTIFTFNKLFKHDDATILLPKLAHLCIHTEFFDESDAARLLAAVNFAQLTYFEFSTFGHRVQTDEPDDVDDNSHIILFRALRKKYGEGVGSERLALKTFRFRSYSPVSPGKDLLSLLSSFATLETFIFEQIDPHVGDPDEEESCEIIQALEGHHGLRWLGLNFGSRHAGRWQVSREGLVKIRDWFPNLRHLSCICREEEKAEFFGVLPTFPKLGSYHIPESNWTDASVIKSYVLPPFLQQMQDGSSGDQRRSWEERYNLSMIVVGDLGYEVASKISPKVKVRHGKPVVEQVNIAGNTVCYRRVPLEPVYDGEYPDLLMMRAQEWRSRNYNGTRGDWLQGIKF
ncbi:hypothetical protein TWF696_007353 [Orbilia brochopaga]|uniref:F-box domain-containing protein n=1 Tax=Orbilia brochopaga TaxID=3140254 RepID=A0AAV9US42_9PEZI